MKELLYLCIIDFVLKSGVMFLAQYYHLNVYKKSFDFLVELTRQTVHFQRDFRYTLGEKLNDSAIEFIVRIYKANSAQNLMERADFIKDMLERLQYINVVLRLSCELKNMSKDKYIGLASMTQDIEKQLNGWLSHSSKNAADVQVYETSKH